MIDLVVNRRFWAKQFCSGFSFFHCLLFGTKRSTFLEPTWSAADLQQQQLFESNTSWNDSLMKWTMMDATYIFTIFNSPRKALSHWVSSGTCILHVSWNNMKQHGTSPPGVHRFYILCRATKRKRLSEKSTPHSSWINVAMGFNNSVLAVNTAIFSWAPQFSSLAFRFRTAHTPSTSKPFANSRSFFVEFFTEKGVKVT